MEMRRWTADGPAGSPFALPRGLRGRLAGLVMLLTNRQREVLDLLAPGPGDHVLEIGYGPGALVRRLTGRAARVCGVDPSAEMRAFARLLAPRADLRVATAERTGFPDASFDRVVSVNNVALWPDLAAGLAEIQRVLRPGGRLVIAWHGGTSPIARRLRLPEDRLEEIRRAMEEHFTDVRRHALTDLVAFTALR